MNSLLLLIFIQIGKHPLNVGLRFAVGGNAAISNDRVFTGIISGKGQGKVSVEILDEIPKVSHAAFDVFLRMERIMNLQG